MMKISLFCLNNSSHFVWVLLW